MTYAQFVGFFNPVIEAFESRNFSQGMLERMHTKVDDFTPLQMKELCNLIIDHCDRPPRVHKISEFAGVIRARARSGVTDPTIDIAEMCPQCRDLRALRVTALDGSHETLMLCECTITRPDRNDWNLPAWIPGFGALYRKEPCPISWFRPTVLINADGEMKLEETLEHKRVYWRAKIQIAEQFWISEREKAGA